MIHVGDVGVLIAFETGENLLEATTHKLIYRKPNRKVGEWEATVQDTKLLYATVAGDIDHAGVYEVQGYAVGPNWTGHTMTDKFTVVANLK